VIVTNGTSTTPLCFSILGGLGLELQPTSIALQQCNSTFPIPGNRQIGSLRLSTTLNILNMKFEILNDSTDTLKLMIEPVPEFYVLEPGVLATLEGESPSNAIPRLDVQPGYIVVYEMEDNSTLRINGILIPPSFE